MASETKMYTFQEVSAHNDFKDCWLVIHGKVYDVTKFLEEHPGGDEVLLSATGKDATDDFEDVGHSTSAKAMMDEYCIGKVNASSLPSKPTYIPKVTAQLPEKSSSLYLKLLQFLAPIGILGLALSLRYFTKDS